MGTRERAAERADTIIDVVVDLLESEGYDAVQVRSVALHARISLATLYKLFPTLNHLIVAALERWMETHAYSELKMPSSDDSPYETMVRVLRKIFEPWERNPRMLEAYHRARSGPGGEELVLQGMAVVKPIVEAVLPDADPEYMKDLELIHEHVTRAAIARFAEGEIKVREVLPILERALYRLTTDNRLEKNRARLRSVGTAKQSLAAKRRRTKATRGR
jgi:TetR/AcrR family transcriptional regulator, cholesterol catabolism regulator